MNTDNKKLMLATKITALRKELNMTQQEFAEKIGITV